MPRVLLMLLVCSVLSNSGCQPEPTQSPSPVQKKPQAVAAQLSVLVVDDPSLTAGLKLLRGEWAQRSGGQLELREWTVAELLAATKLSADLIVYPSRHVGTLVDRDWLRPLRNSVLRNKDLAWNDIFPLVRNTTLRYGNQIYGLSLGEPPLLLAIPLPRRWSAADSGPLPTEAPTTWQATRLSVPTENSALDHPRAAELLARGIAFAQHRSQSVGWFDVDSMQPQLVSAPFIRAFEQMRENNKHSVKQPDQGLSLSWPGINTSPQGKHGSKQPMRFAPLPRAGQIYNPLRETWEDNDVQEPLVYLGFAGRSASVARSTRNSASAFKLLSWMISESIATQLSPRSAATVWSRTSQGAKAEKWLAGSEVCDETAAIVSRQLTADRHYLLPRIPGIDEYMQIMEAAVSAALSDGLSAENLLSKVAQQWNRLTDRYGRDRQRLAYRRHLGISEE